MAEARGVASTVKEGGMKNSRKSEFRAVPKKLRYAMTKALATLYEPERPKDIAQLSMLNSRAILKSDLMYTRIALFKRS